MSPLLIFLDTELLLRAEEKELQIRVNDNFFKYLGLAENIEDGSREYHWNQLLPYHVNNTCRLPTKNLGYLLIFYYMGHGSVPKKYGVYMYKLMDVYTLVSNTSLKWSN